MNSICGESAMAERFAEDNVSNVEEKRKGDDTEDFSPVSNPDCNEEKISKAKIEVPEKGDDIGEVGTGEPQRLSGQRKSTSTVYGGRAHNKLLASLKLSATPSHSRLSPDNDRNSNASLISPSFPYRGKSKAPGGLLNRHRSHDIEESDGPAQTNKAIVPDPLGTPMKRFGAISPFGADPSAKEEVLATASVKPSAAFPAGTARIGPYSFRKLKLLGKGGAGTVYLVVLRGTDSVYAMKELTKEDMIKRKKVMRVMTEREILATANHPFIVTMYATFQTHHRLCFVMDYCAGGEFFGVLSRQPQKRLQESAARFYAAEVLLALEYLHYLGFFYRDLKPENILMRDSGHIALTDFDLSKQAQAVSPRMVEHHRSMFEKLSLLVAGKNLSKIGAFEIVDSEPVLEADSNSFVGTLEYLAPELVKGECQGSAVDWWTFGILIYEMMTGTTPFRAKTSDEILAKITGSDRVHWDGDIGSSEARKIVRKLLKRDQKKRLGSENGATDIKNHPWFAGINFSLIRNDQPPIIPSNVPSLDDFEGVDLDRGDQDDSSSSSSEDEAFADFQMKRDNPTAY